MDYEAFYKEELFPKEKVEITDDYLKKHGWHSYDYSFDKKHRWYSFDNGRIGRIKVVNYGNRKYYTLHIKYEDQDRRSIRFVSDIKANVYSYLCGSYGIESKKDGTYGDIEEDEKRNKWMYKEYKEMTKGL